MTKNDFAITPPMGWNSYDYYDTAVTEEQVKANADFMAKHLKAYGYEYIVVDIEWYSNDAATKRDKYQYIPFGDDEIDPDDNGEKDQKAQRIEQHFRPPVRGRG